MTDRGGFSRDGWDLTEQELAGSYILEPGGSDLKTIVGGLPPGQARRLAEMAYALGYVHADNGTDAELPHDDPAWQAVQDLPE